MQSLLNIHRSIVRAAMAADGWKLIGEFHRCKNEEYGKYVYVLSEEFDADDPRSEIMICDLNEDDGCIDVLTLDDIADNDEHEHITLIHQIIDSYKLKLESVL